MVKANKSRFSEIIELPVESQLAWVKYRDSLKSVTLWKTIVDGSACPIHACAAKEGQECKTEGGIRAHHKSRSNEYFAGLWLDSQATPGAKSQAIGQR